MQKESFKCLSHRAGRLGVASLMTTHGNSHYAFQTLNSGLSAIWVLVTKELSDPGCYFINSQWIT